MSVDTPAKIAILGTGPIGLEAALYARFLGYDVEIFDRGEVADNVRRWGHVRMFSPFGMNASPLGLAALSAQDEAYRPPDADDVLTGRAWLERYLFPLAQTDLLADHLRLRTTVVSVTRRDYLKGELVGDDDRADSPFRILLRERDGREWESAADVVIDATGVFGHPNRLGSGGGLAIGERAVMERIDYSIPDVLGVERERFAHRRVLVVGGGHSAATSVVALSQLAREATDTRVTWLTRGRAGVQSSASDEESSDPLPERAQLIDAANTAARDASVLTCLPNTTIQSLVWDDSRNEFDVEFTGEHAGRAAFQRIIANIGYRPDPRLYEELQVHICYATDGPMKLAAQLANTPNADCLAQTPHGPTSLLTPEPHFYILGAKSYGRNPNFLVAIGLQQIRDLFTIIGDRENLDLYRSPLLS